MRKTRKSKIEVKIGRFNEATQTVEVSKDSTVEDVLEAANITLGNSETIWVDGVEADLEDGIEDGDFLQLVGKKEGGCIGR